VDTHRRGNIDLRRPQSSSDRQFLTLSSTLKLRNSISRLFSNIEDDMYYQSNTIGNIDEDLLLDNVDGIGEIGKNNCEKNLSTSQLPVTQPLNEACIEEKISYDDLEPSDENKLSAAEISAIFPPTEESVQCDDKERTFSESGDDRMVPLSDIGILREVQDSVQELIKNSPSNATSDVVEIQLTTADINAIFPSTEESVKCADVEPASPVSAFGSAQSPSPTIVKKITPLSVRDIMKFAIPAVGVWLCNPILGMIDTSAVGLLSGTTQQAALNPAVAVSEYAALLIAFMYAATTNLIAAAQEVDNGKLEQTRTVATFKATLQLSTYVGTALCGLLLFFSRPLLLAIIGSESVDPIVLSSALRYVRIRSLGMPAAAIIGSAQSACLGMKDIRSPLYVLVAAALVNFASDMLLVGIKHPWIGGASGAAWATVFSQYSALLFFMKWLTWKRKPKGDASVKKLNITDTILEMTTSAPSTEKKLSRTSRIKDRVKSAVNFSGEKNAEKKKDEVSSDKDKDVTARGVLVGKIRKRDLFKFPEMKLAKEFKPFFLPVTATSVGRVSGYVSMCHVVSTAFGTTDLAAQQVILSVFYCLCPIADSLSLTAQSFIPSFLEKKGCSNWAPAFRKTILSFIKTGAIFGLFMSAAVGCSPAVSKYLTKDAMVLAKVKDVIPYLVGVFSIHGVVQAAEGILLGIKDLSFLGRLYGLFFAVVPWFMFRVKKASLAGTKNLGLPSVWKVFLGYQIIRCAIWVSRMFLMTRKEIYSEIQMDSVGSKKAGDIDTMTDQSQISADEITVKRGINLDDTVEVVLN